MANFGTLCVCIRPATQRLHHASHFSPSTSISICETSTSACTHTHTLHCRNDHVSHLSEVDDRFEDCDESSVFEELQSDQLVRLVHRQLRVAQLQDASSYTTGVNCH